MNYQTDLPSLMKRAEEIYFAHFPTETHFERAVFFSWGCRIGDCAFCYMSTQPKGKPPEEARRSTESILAEFILAKNLGWEIGFFSGGTNVIPQEEMIFLLKAIQEITGEKTWLNVGPLSHLNLEDYAPYLKGVVGSIETVNPGIHRKVCPSKPVRPYESMFAEAKKLGLKRGMTIILGLGETEEDLPLLLDFIRKYGISKLHLYSLIPHPGTLFENSPLPSQEYQAWWIAQLRINFSRLDIQCGIWEDRVERTSFLLKAGANSFSKFKALKLFGTKVASRLEEQAGLAGRKFEGTLTLLPDVDWEKEVSKLSIDEGLKRKIKEKLKLYLTKINRSAAASRCGRSSCPSSVITKTCRVTGGA